MSSHGESLQDRSWRIVRAQYRVAPGVCVRCGRRALCGREASVSGGGKRRRDRGSVSRPLWPERGKCGRGAGRGG